MDHIKSFKLNLKNIYGIETKDRKKKLASSLVLAEKVMNSEEFKTWFFKTDFTQADESSRTDGKSKEDLYDMLMQEASFDYSIARRSWWKRFSTVMGWEDDSGVHTYSDTYDGLSVAGLAGHLVHEGVHALGFSHSFDWSSERDMSYPYAIGNYVEAHANIATPLPLKV